MAILLLAIFIAVPVIEIALFIEIGGWIGLWPTIAIVIVTAFAGTTLLRLQGLAVLRRVQESAARNELPVQEVFDGLCLLVAGVMLLTPGFFTDALGFLLFVPVFRRFAGAAIWRWMVRNGNISVSAGGFGSAGGSSGSNPRNPTGPGGGPVIDGDFEEVDPPRDRIEPRDRS
tara:strand:+ start:2121 stop:2639 length:519 start_codon:yes stop_codon:yes gene_type:complete